MKQIQVTSIQDYTSIEPKDIILFLKPSLGRLHNTGGADYVLTVDRTSPDFNYTYNPSEYSKEVSVLKVYNGSLFSLAREFKLFKVNNMTFQEVQEYLRTTKDNLSVLHQFIDDLKSIMKLDESVDLGERIDQILSESQSSIIFCNFLNSNLSLIHKIHFDSLVIDEKQKLNLIKLENSLKVIFG